jgi:lysyl-tRNA synthetase class 2
MCLKGETLREAGFNPYAYRFDATATCAQLQEKYAHLEPGEEVELEGGT